jgi:hypothetical protein
VRKRKVNYPPAKTANRPPPPTGLPNDTPMVRPTVATIDLTAGKGRAGLTVGGRVRIAGSGLYSGEIAVIEKLVTGVIPQAVVRTEAGKTRQVRTIDLEPVAAGVTNAPPAALAAAPSATSDEPTTVAPRTAPSNPPAASAEPGPSEA